jgi:hypothetical protein
MDRVVLHLQLCVGNADMRYVVDESSEDEGNPFQGSWDHPERNGLREG